MKKILLSVTGLTPQVVTETLYALYKKNEAPDCVFLITTGRGKNRAMRDLLDEKDGRFHEFCECYGLKNICFSEKNILVITDKHGALLDDIRTPEDNDAAADFIMAKVREFCAQPGTQLHVSLAGGRKSMGFLVGYALSIFGREQDKLSHVLASEPFENNRDFYYPTLDSRIIVAPNGTELNTSEASVGLAEIPFIRLRTGLTADVLSDRLSFGETVELAQRDVAPELHVKFSYSDHSVFCSGQKIELAPVKFALYLWLARRACKGLPPIRPSTKQDVLDYLSCLKSIKDENDGDYRRVHSTLKSPEYLLAFVQEHRSRLNNSIKEVLGIRAAPYLIKSTRRKPGSEYFLDLLPSQIELD